MEGIIRCERVRISLKRLVVWDANLKRPCKEINMLVQAKKYTIHVHHMGFCLGNSEIGKERNKGSVTSVKCSIEFLSLFVIKVQKFNGHTSCWTAWLMQVRTFGDGAWESSWETGLFDWLGLDCWVLHCWVLSGELENTNIRTISKWLFRKKNTQQLIDVSTLCKHTLERKRLLLEVSWGELQPTRAGGACHAACLPALWSASCWLWLCFHCRTNQFNFLDCNPLPHPAVCFFCVNFLPF